MQHSGAQMKRREPHFEFSKSQFEGLKNGVLHVAPWHHTMMVLLLNGPLTRMQIENKYKRSHCLSLIQPDNSDSIDVILHDLMCDYFVDIDENGRYYISSDTPLGGKSHSSIQWDKGGLIPIDPYKPEKKTKENRKYPEPLPE